VAKAGEHAAAGVGDHNQRGAEVTVELPQLVLRRGVQHGQLAVAAPHLVQAGLKHGIAGHLYGSSDELMGLIREDLAGQRLRAQQALLLVFGLTAAELGFQSQ
jgi:hypothetical protein